MHFVLLKIYFWLLHYCQINWRFLGNYSETSYCFLDCFVCYCSASKTSYFLLGCFVCCFDLKKYYCFPDCFEWKKCCLRTGFVSCWKCLHLWFVGFGSVFDRFGCCSEFGRYCYWTMTFLLIIRASLLLIIFALPAILKSEYFRFSIQMLSDLKLHYTWSINLDKMHGLQEQHIKA